MTCNRCAKAIVYSEVCWFCHDDLCPDCWETHGHCGHLEADRIEKRAQGRAEPMDHQIVLTKKGSLAFCEVCRGGEASLATECPGRPLSQSEQDSIQTGRCDFRNGRWWRWEDFEKIRGEVDRLKATLAEKEAMLEANEGRTKEVVDEALVDKIDRLQDEIHHVKAGQKETERRLRKLREAASQLIDGLCLPGHPIADAWSELCLLSGRFQDPFLKRFKHSEDPDGNTWPFACPVDVCPLRNLGLPR